MIYATEYIIDALKTARQKKRLSQRDLSARTGVPQSHLSRIESGAVDMKVSSLIELARVLDLEVMLVPRRLVPAIQAVLQSAAQPSLQDEEPPRPAYSLDEDADGG